jgi:hypothetical protein
METVEDGNRDFHSLQEKIEYAVRARRKMSVRARRKTPYHKRSHYRRRSRRRRRRAGREQFTAAANQSAARRHGLVKAYNLGQRSCRRAAPTGGSAERERQEAIKAIRRRQVDACAAGGCRLYARTCCVDSRMLCVQSTVLTASVHRMSVAVVYTHTRTRYTNTHPPAAPGGSRSRVCSGQYSIWLDIMI